jgi:hypothetical protein
MWCGVRPLTAVAMQPVLGASGVLQRRRGVEQRRARSHPPNESRARPITYMSLHTSRARPQTHRARPQTHARAKPCLAARSYNADAPLQTSRERSQTHAWAKPCLAGRPTALVRTQPPEQNTSRGRPSGMELPDYPVVAVTPTPQDQDGPALPLPTGSFFKFVARSASRRSTFPVLVTRSASRRPSSPRSATRHNSEPWPKMPSPLCSLSLCSFK